MKTIQNLLIISGGSIDIAFAREYIQGKTFDRVIAADAGLDRCKEIGCTPTDILGDFDSLENKELLAEYQKKGVPIREFPTRKDYTDTHLALKYAMDFTPEEVIVLGATGTRMDHTLANIGLLSMMADVGISCHLVDKHNDIEMLCGQTEKKYPRPVDKTYFSLIAFSPEVTGIDEEGFSYPLHQAVLHSGESIGVSNEIIKEEGILRLKTGYLLVMQTKD